MSFCIPYIIDINIIYLIKMNVIFVSNYLTQIDMIYMYILYLCILKCFRYIMLCVYNIILK